MATRWSGLPEFSPELAGVGVGDGEVDDGVQLGLANTDGNTVFSGAAPNDGKSSPECGADGRRSGTELR